ncbi:hypothetical protein CDD81_4666 [Ophiocordyceps australis]|uniref:SUN domain-containing protein n=1 Tax=Ophiocordyceps australis TaxID=1399860 RepID=A0A2C5XND6_9HYPO|nr:hypothetical protein CDD81_4666 [Ophiocordyceps australis]
MSSRPTTSRTSNQSHLEEQTLIPSAGIDVTETEAHSAASAFLSFEDWKELMLRRAGQDPQIWRSRKPSQRRPDAGGGDASTNSAVGLGEEGEISLDFGDYQTNGAYKNTDMPGTIAPAGHGTGGSNDDEIMSRNREYKHDDQGLGDDSNLAHSDAGIRRSRDAGKTCKERFSYSSFDAGATMLKTAPGAKNARAILVENKDSYMLLECAAPSKYIIVELSDDILIDTIVLANFEFFSSMIRHFRVSVSDRYPVKADKWRELGTFEARNSRDLQPFLVENPQMWAKYLRIDFLTHYGTEYYCPVSLLRVHGSRMLDSWKDSETGRQDDAYLDASATSVIQQAAVSLSPSSSTIAQSSNSVQPHRFLAQCVVLSALQPHHYQSATCPATPPIGTVATNWHSVTPSQPSDATPSTNTVPQPSSVTCISADTGLSPALASHGHNITTPGTLPPPAAVVLEPSLPGSASTLARSGTGNSTAACNTTYTNTVSSPVSPSFKACTAPTATGSTAGGLDSTTSGGKPRASGSFSSATTPPSPTVHEGFFNAITKRLQQVESNLTLSLKYVEEQSRHLREALMRGEQKQQSAVSLFLRSLNQTVLAELHHARDQYHQLWQSTVLALDSQADRADRDLVALSTRLNLLADEVVFQKRMAIVQALVLLSCLFLVIFSRGGVPLPASFSSSPSGHSMHTLPTTCDSLSTAGRTTTGPIPCQHGLSSSLPPMPGIPADSATAATDRARNLSLQNSRKPLPSLPEHPPITAKS